MNALDIYRALENRIVELSPSSRERLLYQLVGAIAVERKISATELHETILRYEKSAREVR